MKINYKSIRKILKTKLDTGISRFVNCKRILMVSIARWQEQEKDQEKDQEQEHEQR